MGGGRRKADAEIGPRAVEELMKKYPTLNDKTICERLGMDRKNLCEWKNGQTPGAFALQRIAFCGCDIKYILTGIRSVKEG